jgi:hypothetical protein
MASAKALRVRSVASFHPNSKRSVSEHNLNLSVNPLKYTAIYMENLSCFFTCTNLASLGSILLSISSCVCVCLSYTSVGVPITSVAKRAEINLFIASCVGNENFPRCLHFFCCFHPDLFQNELLKPPLLQSAFYFH